MLVINPDECIDCGVCEPECPVEAIKPESEDTIDWQEINAEYSKKWPNINRKKEAPEDAENFVNIANKFEKYFTDAAGEGD
jgi:ferredoxin